MNKFLKFWYKSFHKLKTWVLLSGLKPPRAEEKKRAEILRGKIKNLQSSGDLLNRPAAEKFWTAYRNNIRRDILQKDPRNFLNWAPIRSSMFHEPEDRLELDILKASPVWPEFQKALVEQKPGNPRPYWFYSQTSGNLLHHAYIWQEFLKVFPEIKTREFKTIFEFGGGYGSFCRLFYRLGFSGKYFIYDLPEFSFLQEYFLNSINIPAALASGSVNSSVSLLDSVEVLRSNANLVESPDLFLATWSLSESPIELREKIFEVVKSPGAFLIAFQGMLSNPGSEVNNLEYFKKFMAQRPGYDWQLTNIQQLPHSYFMLGRKKL